MRGRLSSRPRFSVYRRQLNRVANSKAKLDFEKNPDSYKKELAATK